MPIVWIVLTVTHLNNQPEDYGDENVRQWVPALP
jgi:hypothetical protein